jgi:hypothetical protein
VETPGESQGGARHGVLVSRNEARIDNVGGAGRKNPTEAALAKGEVRPDNADETQDQRHGMDSELIISA